MGMEMNRKGSISDLFYLIIVLVLFAVVSITMWTVMKAWDDGVQAAPDSQFSTEGKEYSGSIRSKFVGIVDNAFMIVFVGIIVAITIGAYFIRIHPSLFWFSIPILAFIIFVAAIYTNFFSGFIAGDLASSAADFTILTFVMNNFVYFMTGTIGIVAAVLFMKNNTPQ